MTTDKYDGAGAEKRQHNLARLLTAQSEAEGKVEMLNKRLAQLLLNDPQETNSETQRCRGEIVRINSKYAARQREISLALKESEY